ncbi:hypothetical protein DMC61_26210 [Amycolatopsis sp. WAC 04169]|uniref:hypothetical protein n=1 Tax=Amycolatopsis sp. WAC 04169 TaxID=2203197 RepID=UPI000F77D67C|nr:hypothetical protein [Amycolatopsis sp. WAC 04169]RSN26950.1 hypothetical protein DMC61_26210 [Amycolatopsis sp. WAC 04169]
MKRSRELAAVGAAMVLATTLVAAGPASGEEAGKGKPAEPSLVGSAKMLRKDGQDVRFAFDAHGLFPESKGTFRVSHVGGGFSAYFKGRIDCLVVGGPVAVVTGIVEDTDVPGLKDRRVGMTVYDNGKRDRLGYSWGPDPEHKQIVPPCLSSATFERVESGDFKAVEWFPPGSGIG